MFIWPTHVVCEWHRSPGFYNIWKELLERNGWAHTWSDDHLTGFNLEAVETETGLQACSVKPVKFAPTSADLGFFLPASPSEAQQPQLDCALPSSTCLLCFLGLSSQNPRASQTAMALSLLPPSKAENCHQLCERELGASGAARTHTRVSRVPLALRLSSFTRLYGVLWIQHTGHLSFKMSEYVPTQRWVPSEREHFLTFFPPSLQALGQACFCAPQQKPTRSRGSLPAWVAVRGEGCSAHRHTLLRMNHTNAQNKMANILGIQLKV